MKLALKPVHRLDNRKYSTATWKHWKTDQIETSPGKFEAAMYGPESQPNNHLLSLWLTAKSLEPDCLNGDKHEKIRMRDENKSSSLALLSISDLHDFCRVHPGVSSTVN